MTKADQIRVGMSTSTSVNNLITCVEEYSLIRDLVILNELVFFWKDTCILFVFDHRACIHTHTSPQPASSRMLWITVHLLLVRSQGPNCLRPAQTTVWINSLSLSVLFSFLLCISRSFFHLYLLTVSVCPSLIYYVPFSPLSSTRQACSLFTLAFSPPSVFLYFCLFHSFIFSFFYFPCIYFIFTCQTELKSASFKVIVHLS